MITGTVSRLYRWSLSQLELLLREFSCPLASVEVVVEYISNFANDLIRENIKNTITRITRIKLIMRSTKTVDKPNESRDTTISRNSRDTRKMKRSYSVAAAEAVMLSPMSSTKRLSMSGKKSSLGKNSKPVVARVRSPKT